MVHRAALPLSPSSSSPASSLSEKKREEIVSQHMHESEQCWLFVLRIKKAVMLMISAGANYSFSEMINLVRTGTSSLTKGSLTITFSV